MMTESLPVNMSLLKPNIEECIILLAPKSNEADIVINEKVFKAPLGYAFFCLPKDQYNCSDSKNINRIFLYGHLVFPMLSKSINNNEFFCTNIHTEIIECMRLLSEDDVPNEENSAFAYKLLMKIKKDSISYNAYNNIYPDIVSAALGIIHDESRYIYGPGEVAEIIGVSSEHLSRVFKKYVGESIGKYMRTEKIKLAKELLGQRELSISMISEICGFADTGYFSKLFKNECGITPSRYRGSILKAELYHKNYSSDIDIWL